MLVVPVVTVALLASVLTSVLTPSLAVALSTTSTAPTPPDLFVAYAPLVSQGNTPGADTAQSFNTATLATLTSPTQGSTASLGSTQVGAQPDAEAVSPDGGTVYVLNSASDTITALNTLSSPPQTSATISLPTGYLPTGIAITPSGEDAYVVGYPTVSNSLTPALWEIELTGSSPGTLARTILLPSSSSPSAIALTPDGLEALVTDYSGGDVIPVTLKSGLLGTAIPVGANPLDIQVSPNGNNAYVANSGDGTVTQIDLTSNTPTTPATTLETGYQPQQVAVSPDGTTLWVTEDSATTPGNAGFVVPVAIPSMTVGSPISVGFDPNGVAASPDGTTVYVANETNGYGVGDTEGSITMVNTTTDVTSSFYTSIDPATVLVTPDEAPVASFVSTPAPAGKATCFDASASYSLTNGGLTYSWNFGDGTVSPPAKLADGYNQTICNTYAIPGTYSVTLAVTDAALTSTSVIYNGQYVLNNGGPSAGQTSDVTIPASTANASPVAYVTDSLANEVTPILALPSQAIAANDAGNPIGVGTHPVAVAITPNGETAYVVNFGSDNVTPINIATNTATPAGAWITVGSLPDAIAITPNGKTAYVANSGDGTISKIALSTGQVLATLTVGGSPSGIAISPDGLTAYVTNNAPGFNNLIPIDLSNDVVEPGVPAGTDPLSIAVTPDGQAALVVDRGSNIVPGAVTPVDIAVYPPTTGTAVAVGNDPSGVAISSDGADAYVTNTADGTLSQIALTNDVAGTVTTSNAGTDPDGVAVTPDGKTAYVADDAPGASTSVGSVSELGLPTAAGVPTPIAVAAGPSSIAITPDQAPVAVLHVTPAPSTETTVFDASESTFPSTLGASYSWDFGDGTSATTTTNVTTHVYAEGGDYTASVSITDADGTSVSQAFTGQTVSLNGGPSATASQSVDIPFVTPTITGVNPSSGDAGSVTSLIVSGTNLFGITSVDVGGVSVTGFSVNAAGTQISSVFAPSTLPAGSVDVTATNPGGTSAITPADVFTYLPTATPVTGAPVVTGLSLPFGPVAGGTGVTITGTNFTGTTAVDFGTTPVTNFTVNGAGTSITVISPAATLAGTVDVTVTTPVAPSAVVAADVFTYLAPTPPSGAPTVTGISPNTGPTSGLTSVVITGTNLSDATAVSFGGEPAESFFSSSNTSVTAVSPATATAGTADVTVTTVLGVTPVVPADAFTYTDGTTSAGPVVSSVTPNAGPLAGGNTVVITGSNFTDLSPSSVQFGSSGEATYAVNSAGTIITASAPASATSVSVDVVVTNPLGASTVTSADTYTYQPNAQFAPVVTTVTPSSGPQAGATTVTLTGSNLASVTAVDFGATVVTSFTTSGSGDEIFVSSPAASVAGTVSVVAVSPYGTSAVVADDAFTYLPANPSDTGPQVTSVVPSIGPVAGGTGVVVNGTGFTSATAADFGVEQAGSFNVNAAGTEITAVVPATGAAGSVDVTVTAGGDTSPVVVADVFTYQTGATAPSATLTTVSPPTGPLTGDSTVTLSGANLSGALIVDFGTTPGTNIVVNTAGTSLTVTSPAAALPGPVSLSVTTPAGPSVPNPSLTYTYLAVPAVFTAMTPHRLLDTRTVGGGGPFGAGETRTLTIGGVAGVPAGAEGVLVNLTVTDTTSSTFETLYPTGTTQPSASNLTAALGQTVGHLVEVPLGTNGQISIYNHSGSSHVVVDLEGYYTAGTATSGGTVNVKPALILNTAAKKGGGPVKAGAPRRLVVTGVGGVPATHVAAVIFYLSANTTSTNSYATVYPAGTAEPVASNVNWAKGTSFSNLVTAKVGSGGAIEIANHLGTANFTVVVTGYVTAAGAPHPGSFNTPLPSALLYNSAAVGSGGPLGVGQVRALTVAGVDGVSASATSVVLDVTVNGATAASALTAYGAGTARPATSTMAWLKGQSVSTLVIVPLGAGGKIDLYNQFGHVNVSVTVEGYYQ